MDSGSKLFATQSMIEFLEKVDFENKSAYDFKIVDVKLITRRCPCKQTNVALTALLNHKFHTVLRIGTKTSLLANVKFADGQFR